MHESEAVIAAAERPGTALILEPKAQGQAALSTRPPEGAGPTWNSPKVITSAVSGTLILAGWLVSWAGGAPWLSQACAVAAIISGAFLFRAEGGLDLISRREVGFYFLMSAPARIVSALIGHAQEGGILVFLTSISEAAQDFTEWKTRSAINALMNLTPRTALVVRGGSASEIPVEEMVVGDVFVVKPGAAIATDGLVATATSR